MRAWGEKGSAPRLDGTMITQCLNGKGRSRGSDLGINKVTSIKQGGEKEGKHSAHL